MEAVSHRGAHSICGLGCGPGWPAGVELCGEAVEPSARLSSTAGFARAAASWKESELGAALQARGIHALAAVSLRVGCVWPRVFRRTEFGVYPTAIAWER